MSCFRLGWIGIGSLLFVCAQATVLAQAGTVEAKDRPAAIKIGDPAPPIDLETLLQAPGGTKTDWDSLRGNVVVLEFWATWCGPCVQSIPMLNKLVDKYKDQPVRFISITDESKSTIESFLEKKPIHAWVGLDTNKSVFKAYGVTGLPATIVIGRDGKVVGETLVPTLFVDRPEILDDLIAGKTAKLSEPGSDDKKTADLLKNRTEELLNQTFGKGGVGGEQVESPLFFMLIRRAQPMKPLLGESNLERTMREITLQSMVLSTYRFPRERLIWNAAISDEKYDVIFSGSRMKNTRAGKALLGQTIEATFGLNIHFEKRMMDVLVLTVEAGKTPPFEPAMSHVYYDSGYTAPSNAILKRMVAGEKFFGAMGDVQLFANGLGYIFGIPVVNETGDDHGYYQFYFPYDVEKRDQVLLRKILKEKFYLNLTPAKREIKVLVVDENTGKKKPTGAS